MSNHEHSVTTREWRSKSAAEVELLDTEIATLKEERELRRSQAKEATQKMRKLSIKRHTMVVDETVHKVVVQDITHVTLDGKQAKVDDPLARKAFALARKAGAKRKNAEAK